MAILNQATLHGFVAAGTKCLVLESSDSLRMTGFSFTAWTNAWRALDLIGIGDSLRQQHYPLQGLLAASMIPGLPTSEISFNVEGINDFQALPEFLFCGGCGVAGDVSGKHEVHSVQRRALVEALQNEVPSGTVRYSSKVDSIEE
ncbi:monooxygenase 2-like [Vitis vinifera]|uniref:monooxygenase 2-like n=1 Tax=Vitis vinifera TaxID=29760 RepID=UPI0008FF8829|nr:monooxygenase 2-like [Vitis vinifera]|eukprot:XP_019074364.1 PREDICTED: uncharacterized protein LOC100253749 [Vitis vinifera]